MMTTIPKTKRWHAVLISLAAVFIAACGANENILKSGKETPLPSNVESSVSSFDKELQAMRTADFRFVYVLRRKDGGAIDAEDRSVIRLQTVDMNRRVAADNDRAFIIGSNAMLPPKNLLALGQRFAVENYFSDPTVSSNANANANGQK